MSIIGVDVGPSLRRSGVSSCVCEDCRTAKVQFRRKKYKTQKDLGEFHQTQWTRVRLVAGVGAQVLGQRGAVREGLVAVWTRVGSFPGVGSDDEEQKVQNIENAKIRKKKSETRQGLLRGQTPKMVILTPFPLELQKIYHPFSTVCG